MLVRYNNYNRLANLVKRVNNEAPLGEGGAGRMRKALE